MQIVSEDNLTICMNCLSPFLEKNSICHLKCLPSMLSIKIEFKLIGLRDMGKMVLLLFLCSNQRYVFIQNLNPLKCLA